MSPAVTEDQPEDGDPLDRRVQVLVSTWPSVREVVDAHNATCRPGTELMSAESAMQAGARMRRERDLAATRLQQCEDERDALRLALERVQQQRDRVRLERDQARDQARGAGEPEEVERLTRELQEAHAEASATRAKVSEEYRAALLAAERKTQDARDAATELSVRLAASVRRLEDADALTGQQAERIEELNAEVRDLHAAIADERERFKDMAGTLERQRDAAVARADEATLNRLARLEDALVALGFGENRPPAPLAETGERPPGE